MSTLTQVACFSLLLRLMFIKYADRLVKVELHAIQPTNCDKLSVQILNCLCVCNVCVFSSCLLDGTTCPLLNYGVTKVRWGLLVSWLWFARIQFQCWVMKLFCYVSIVGSWVAMMAPKCVQVRQLWPSPRWPKIRSFLLIISAVQIRVQLLVEDWIVKLSLCNLTIYNKQFEICFIELIETLNNFTEGRIFIAIEAVYYEYSLFCEIFHVSVSLQGNIHGETISFNQ